MLIVNTWAHLARRFFGSLSRAESSPADEAWVAGVLTPAEATLWRRMSAADRRHAVGVARAATAMLDDRQGASASDQAQGPSDDVPARSDDLVGPSGDPLRPVAAAALLHDVGKIESGFGPLRRAVATVVAMIVGLRRARDWRHRSGLVGRTGRYLCHDEIGAGLLAQAGSHPLTVAWAREHHLPAHRWSIPADIGAALKAADDD
jgi:hypothetical protein